MLSINSLFVFDATHREPVGTEGVAHAGIAAMEVQAVAVVTVGRTAPIVAVVTLEVERTIVAVAVARRRQFKG